MKKKLIVLAVVVAVSVALSSCGFSGQVNIPLPSKLGGGTLPITIYPSK